MDFTPYARVLQDNGDGINWGEVSMPGYVPAVTVLGAGLLGVGTYAWGRSSGSR